MLSSEERQECEGLMVGCRLWRRESCALQHGCQVTTSRDEHSLSSIIHHQCVFTKLHICDSNTDECYFPHGCLACR